MKVVLPGGSGYLGRALSRRLVERGDDVVVLSRSRAGRADGITYATWDGRTPGDWASEVDGADAIVHLAGRRVDVRPTRPNIEALRRSRTESVAAVGHAVAAASSPPATWVQLSTVAIHGDTGDRLLDDTTPVPADGPAQMTGVATAWEAAHLDAVAGTDLRSVLVRAGVVIGPDDPASVQLARLARVGLGGPVGGGRQWVSWLALQDMVRALLWFLDTASASGPYLVTSPNPVTNAEMMAAYRTAVGRRSGLPSPAWLASIGAWVLGSDPALALTSRRAVPSRLTDEGFAFRTPDLPTAVRHALADGA